MSMSGKLRIKRYIFLVLSILTAALIFSFSNQTAEVSSGNSEGLIRFIMDLIPWTAGMAEQSKLEILEGIHNFVRKTAHFSIYALLGICVFNYILTYISAKKKAFLFSVIICFLYACTDEVHQLFIEGRSGEMRDVVIDTCGSLTGMLLVLAATAIFVKLRRCKSEQA